LEVLINFYFYRFKKASKSAIKSSFSMFDRELPIDKISLSNACLLCLTGGFEMRFIGREKELAVLQSLQKKETASLACITGRRRIGKSYLIQKFAQSFQFYTEIQGLGPHSNFHSKKDQLAHFATELSHQFNIKKQHYEDWDDAFIHLSEVTSKGEHLVLLDEISWMAKDDPLFSAKIKSAWDSRLKKNPKLILVLCGSVSSWIEENILKNTNFEGRVSLQINLKELPIEDCLPFLDKSIGPYELMTILSITGGVPKYLEEFYKKGVSNKQIAEFCFSESGLLFNDFEKIFAEIFTRKSKTYERIIRACLYKKLSPLELSRKCKIEYNSDFLHHLHHLELSGFVSRDYYFKPENNQPSKFSHIRLKDNYLRFYLKIIEPLKLKIQTGAKKIDGLTELKNLESIMGYQFENILLANRERIHQLLNITASEINSSSPYVQKKTATNKGACQIDLLIHTNLDVFYLCEFKCQKRISKSIISETEKKVNMIKVPRRSSVKPVLIYLGELEPDHESEIEDYFYKCIPFERIYT